MVRKDAQGADFPATFKPCRESGVTSGPSKIESRATKREDNCSPFVAAAVTPHRNFTWTRLTLCAEAVDFDEFERQVKLAMIVGNPLLLIFAQFVLRGFDFSEYEIVIFYR